MVGTEYLNADRHVVQFYRHDEELAERVAGYLLEALGGGGAAVVIATPEHRREFEDRLRQALGGGADLTAARDSGTYLALDASQTLRELMPVGRLDLVAFDRVIGGLIGRPGRAGGRSVPTARWSRCSGTTGSSTRRSSLRTMWEELGRTHSFSLFCGYPAGSATRDGHLDAFAAVCRLHREVVGLSPAAASGSGGPAAMRTYPFSRDAPAAARHFAVGMLRDWGAGDIADDAALVVTELAANAIVHAHSAFTISLSAHGDLVRISVRDASPLPGAPGAALAPAPLHGLGVVDALASRWGVESLGNAGKTVWVELRR